MALKNDKSKDIQNLELINLPGEEEQEEYVKHGIWSKVKETAGKVPFIKDALAMYYCAIDAKTPLTAKAVAFAALAYFILPADVAADVLPLVGYADDAGVVALAIRTISEHITDEHRKKVEEFLDAGRERV